MLGFRALQALGKHGIICIEDLVHEIHTCGPAFKQVTYTNAVPRISSAHGTGHHERHAAALPQSVVAACWREFTYCILLASLAHTLS